MLTRAYAVLKRRTVEHWEYRVYVSEVLVDELGHEDRMRECVRRVRGLRVSEQLKVVLL